MIEMFLWCTIALFVFLALLKVADTCREIAFEVRETRRVLEQQTVRLETKIDAVHSEWWAWSQNDSAQRAEDARRRTKPTLDEVMEDLG